MKFLPSQLSYLLEKQESRRNLAALTRYLVVLAAIIVLYSVVFHFIMAQEGQDHSWLTGFYWTLTVMSTLGFGDITFHSDLGRGFSILVLLTGIIMLLIVLPFAFIRFFYAPWLEAQLRVRAPRKVPDGMRDHVVLCRHDDLAAGLVARLKDAGVPYCLIEPDPAVATSMHGDGMSVVTGEPTAPATLAAAGAERARLVFANLGDAPNSNATLAVREVAPDVPILALAEEEHSIDVLELSGATRVLPLKHELGEHLAGRVTVGAPQARRIGRFEDLVIAEFPIELASLSGRTIRDTKLRQLTGISIVGVWERGKLLPATPDTVLTDTSVPVVVGTESQIAELDALFVIYQQEAKPVLVIGGGKVGLAAARALHRRSVSVTVLERDPELRATLESVADKVVIGDAADLDAVMGAGLADASSVLLTTNDDSTNMFLAIYCRRLNPGIRIVSRISEEWNLEAIHRAGADFALSHSSLAAKFVLAAAQHSELVVLGEGCELFIEPVPRRLEGRTLAQSGIGAETGLTVLAVRAGGSSATNPAADTLLEANAELVLLGSAPQHDSFLKTYEERRASSRPR